MNVLGRIDDADRSYLEDEENLDWPETSGEDLEKDVLDDDEWESDVEDLDVEESELKWAINQEVEEEQVI